VELAGAMRYLNGKSGAERRIVGHVTSSIDDQLAAGPTRAEERVRSNMAEPMYGELGFLTRRASRAIDESVAGPMPPEHALKKIEIGSCKALARLNR
jgi:hypothetical protein